VIVDLTESPAGDGEGDGDGRRAPIHGCEALATRKARFMLHGLRFHDPRGQEFSLEAV
jgi:hypothetical protein